MFQPISYQRAFAIMWGLAICPLPAVLLFSCVTVQGAIFAAGALLLGLAPALAFMNPESDWLRRSGYAGICSWLLITA
jgi:hypothetical protein